MPEARRRTISILVENQPGVLVKVAGLFRRRGYNIHSLAVGITEAPDVSRIITVVEASPAEVEQVIKQLHKIIEVLRVNDLTETSSVDRELALIKVAATAGGRAEIIELATIFRANVVDLSDKTMTLEVTGRTEKIDAMLSLLRKHGIREMVRTGQVTLTRGAQAT
ncbi:MAG: acetolactate synthase small subunit [Armatimonadetes bacterium]|nr:acetolactate synthase small subunit [Armatimonadota bacterium]